MLQMRLAIFSRGSNNAACLGYSCLHQIRQEAALFYMYIPQKYCPGTAICINGEIYRGYKNFAGELRPNSFDIPWTDEAFFRNSEDMCRKIAHLLIGLSAVLAPQQIVLCCEAVSEDQLIYLKQIVKDGFDRFALPEIHRSESFEADFEAGMIQTARSQFRREQTSWRSK